jgi:hypothetical protein
MLGQIDRYLTQPGSARRAPTRRPFAKRHNDAVQIVPIRATLT